MARPWRLQYRILVPFVAVAIAATLVTAFVALSVVSRALESRLIAQVRNAASVISRSDFALNDAILGSARQIAGADVITFTDDGTILAATIDRQSDRALLAAIATPAAAREALAATPGSTVVRRPPCGAPCFVAYAPVAIRPGTVVAVVARTAELGDATRVLTRTILMAAGVSLLLMAMVSHVVARRVTAPLDALVAFAREVSAEGSTARAPSGDDEIGRLGAAFNDMLDRLDRSRDAQVRSEKLGLAGLMAARVAHDIRNPLSSMKMQAQLLAAGVRDRRDASELVGAILRDIQQLESVVRDLIELARPGDLHRRAVSLNAVVDEVLNHLAPQLTYRKIDVHRALAADLPLADLDADRFRQVLLNVIGNAADAMPTGGTLEVATARDAGTLLLDIADNGIGIEPAIRDRLFDPFVSTKRDGVGLGLVNARAVVEQHGGRIELAPRERRGTRARITLPVVNAEQTRRSVTEPAHG